MRLQKRIKEKQEERKRSLYVRLPHVIRKEEDVARLFAGEFQVKLRRQSSKYCYVVFNNDEEKLKNLKAAQDTEINGKRVVIAPATTKIQKETKVPKKKVKIPKVKADVKVSRILFVSNIKCTTKVNELKEAIPGCVSAKLLNPYSQDFRGAMIKVESIKLAIEYVKRIKEWPVVNGHQLRFKPDTRKKQKKVKSEDLKFYDGEKEIEPLAVESEEDEDLGDIVLENTQ